MGQPRRPLLRLAWSDPESDATGFVVVDRLVTGISTGGLRTRAGCTMEEVEDLAREMSLKTGVYRLPVGGAKGGIDYPADAPDVNEVRRRFVTAMRPLLDTVWVTAGDLGTPQARLDSVFAEAGLGPSSLRAALLRSPEPNAAVTRVQRLFGEGDHGLRMPDLSEATASLRLPSRDWRALGWPRASRGQWSRASGPWVARRRFTCISQVYVSWALAMRSD